MSESDPPDPTYSILSSSQSQKRSYTSDEALVTSSKRLHLTEPADTVKVEDQCPFGPSTSLTTVETPAEVPDVKMSSDPVLLTSSSSSSEPETPSVPMPKRWKGKARAKDMPFLPDEVWRRVFMFLYDASIQEWHAGASLSNIQSSLLICRDLTQVAIPVLYSHPHVEHEAIRPFINCIKNSATATPALKISYVRSLTVRASSSRSSRSTSLGSLSRELDHSVVHSGLKDLLGLFPDLHSFTLKDTLIQTCYDVKTLFDALSLIKPQKARLELRLWDLNASPAGKALILATRPDIHAKPPKLPSPPSPAPGFEGNQVDVVRMSNAGAQSRRTAIRPTNNSYRYQDVESERNDHMQVSWLNRLRHGEELELPLGWLDPDQDRRNVQIQAQQAAQAQAQIAAAAAATGLTIPFPGITNHGTAGITGSTGSGMFVTHAVPMGHQPNSTAWTTALPTIPGSIVSAVPALHAGNTLASNSIVTQPDTAVIDSDDEMDGEINAMEAAEDIVNDNAVSAAGQQTNIPGSPSVSEGQSDLSRRRRALQAAPTSGLTLSQDDPASSNTNSARAEEVDAAPRGFRRIPKESRVPVRPSLFIAPDQSRSMPGNDTATSASHSQPATRRNNHANAAPVYASRDDVLSRTDHIYRPAPAYGSNRLQGNHNDLGGPNDASTTAASNASSRAGPSAMPTVEAGLTTATSSTIVTTPTTATTAPPIGGTRIATPTPPILAEQLRSSLLTLLRDTWSNNIKAFSFVAFDPVSSLVVRAPKLNLWTQIPIPHIRIHLPLAVDSLAVFKGAREVSRERDRRAAQRRAEVPNNDNNTQGVNTTGIQPILNPTPTINVSAVDNSATDADGQMLRIVGGDGFGGGLVHEDNRLFEIEVNTLADMEDSSWLMCGDQLPPQVCRILAGRDDWEDITTDIHNGDTPHFIESVASPAVSRATSQFASPAYSWVVDDDLDTISEIGSQAGESYDPKAAREQMEKQRLARLSK